MRERSEGMTLEQMKVKEFHEAFGLLINDVPTLPGLETVALRESLIREELQEFSQACFRRDIVSAADALADLLYVVYGAAVSLGVDMEPVFDEVHRSNMTKVGGHRREDGKWVKPDTYSPARLELILEAQGKAEGTLEKILKENLEPGYNRGI